jgi:hypothetical protein
MENSNNNSEIKIEENKPNFLHEPLREAKGKFLEVAAVINKARGFIVISAILSMVNFVYS